GRALAPKRAPDPDAAVPAASEGQSLAAPARVVPSARRPVRTQSFGTLTRGETAAAAMATGGSREGLSRPGRGRARATTPARLVVLSRPPFGASTSDGRNRAISTAANTASAPSARLRPDRREIEIAAT